VVKMGLEVCFLGGNWFFFEIYGVIGKKMLYFSLQGVCEGLKCPAHVFCR